MPKRPASRGLIFLNSLFGNKICHYPNKTHTTNFMNTSSDDSEQPPVPLPDELPSQEPDEFQDVPLPKKVTREADALHEKEDLRQGDEGIDDPPPESDQMGD